MQSLLHNDCEEIRVESSEQIANVEAETGSSGSEEEEVVEEVVEMQEHEHVDGINVVSSDGVVRRRGRTTLKGIWALESGYRVQVPFNSRWQAIGREARLLASFCGMLARTGKYCPVNFRSWIRIPKENKKIIEKLIKEKFMIPFEPKAWKFVMRSTGKKYNQWKHKLKSLYFNPYQNLDYHAKNVPPDVVDAQWADLVIYWMSDKGKQIAESAVVSRSHQQFTHTSGSKSIARREKELEDEMKRPIGRVDMYIDIRTKPDKKFMSEEAENYAVKMIEIMEKEKGTKELSNEELIALQDKAFTQVLGKDCYGRVRCLGFGAIPGAYYGNDRQGQSQYQVENMKQIKKLEAILEGERAARKVERQELEAKIEEEKSQRQKMQSQILSIMNMFKNQFFDKL